MSQNWEVEVGDGLASVVVRDNTVFATALVTPRNKKESHESVFAIDTKTGKIRWKHTYYAGRLEKQEAFGGRMRAPQATPALIGNRLITIGFTGVIHGYDATTGEIAWQYSAVKDFEATPVQFGFSASPVPMATKSGNRVFILAGGSEGGLVCVAAKDGRRLWNIPCGEASYATPVLLNHPQGKQVVFQDRNELISADAMTGRVLWRYKLPESGLTNVPTPLPTSDHTGLIVSGQGIGGTKRIQLVAQQQADSNSKGWSVEEFWFNRSQFFYCNWIIRDNLLIGCNSKIVVVLDLDTGKSIAKWRGFVESNLLQFKDGVLLLDGKGKLSRLKTGKENWFIHDQFQLCDTRVWTPLTFSNGQLYCRAGKKLSCTRLCSLSQAPKNVLAPLKIRDSNLKLASRKQSANFVQQIIDTFETDGPQAAITQYRKIREQEKRLLTLSDRTELLKLAASQGYYDFARIIEAQAREDFQDNSALAQLNDVLKRLLKHPSSKITRNTKGVAYVEIAIRNGGDKKRDTYVRGPSGRRFSYGIPFPPGIVRIEKWPVGTKLFWAVNDQPGREILTVQESMAGKTIDIDKNQ